MAIYDLKLSGQARELVLNAIREARGRGVEVRLLFNVDHPRPPARPLPPPGFVDSDFLRHLEVPYQPVDGVPDLMHHKYVVRDVGTPSAAVWTGSTNWTGDSWTREENVLLKVVSAEVADAYRHNFDELWEKPKVADSGHQDPVWTELDAATRARAYFTPGRSKKLVHEIAQRIALAERRLLVCSPVISSGPILGALAEAVHRPGLRVAGVYDGTQMAEVRRQWKENGQSAWKLHAFDAIVSAAPFGAKASTPWQPGTVHDFMHAKALVADDCVLTGSYNLSHSGEENAENVIEVESRGLADLFAGFVERVAQLYPPASGTIGNSG
jgi:phosphatidylserine/phosphatidylglycerophosphate/cardiolipin synthase-like enzyme